MGEGELPSMTQQFEKYIAGQMTDQDLAEFIHALILSHTGEQQNDIVVKFFTRFKLWRRHQISDLLKQIEDLVYTTNQRVERIKERVAYIEDIESKLDKELKEL